VARLDRLKLQAEKRSGTRLPAIQGFRVVRDSRVKPQGKVPTYARVRALESRTTGCRIFVQYQRRRGWLASFFITIIGDDKLGITPEDIVSVRAGYRLQLPSLVELALDFCPTSRVDRVYVLKHGRFGKSRLRTDRGGAGGLRFGSRGSPKMVRAYAKQTVGRFRVELELHAAFLRRFSINDCEQLYLVASYLLPGHVRFVGFRWTKLEFYLLRRFGAAGRVILAESRRLRDEGSLRQAVRFLSAKGVSNPHRFFLPLRINRNIRQALREWAVRFYTLAEDFPLK